MLSVSLWKRWRFSPQIYFLAYFLCSQACWIARQKGNCLIFYWLENSWWDLNTGPYYFPHFLACCNMRANILQQELYISCLLPVLSAYVKKTTCDRHLLCSHVQTCQGITGYAVKGRSSFWSNSTCNCFSTSLCWCRSTSRRKVTSVFTNYSFHFLMYFICE